MTSGQRSETLDTVYGLLANSRRRHVLYHFVANEIGYVESLSRAIAAHEGDVPHESVDEGVRGEVAASLLHNHLPKLAAHGVVEYDARSGDVVRSEGFAEIRPFVERTRSIDREAARREGHQPSS